MKIILLEGIPKLGTMGATVTVRDGFARNYLLPQGKALRATPENLAKFEQQKAELQKRNDEKRAAAQELAAKIQGEPIVLIRSAGDSGQLYGSVSTRDIADSYSDKEHKVSRNQVRLDQPIKTIGLHDVVLQLHPEVEITVTVNVARSQDEAERQLAGEVLTGNNRYEEDDTAETPSDEDNTEEAEADAEADNDDEQVDA
jgi:large subunit ribosomal protein L9